MHSKPKAFLLVALLALPAAIAATSTKVTSSDIQTGTVTADVGNFGTLITNAFTANSGYFPNLVVNNSTQLSGTLWINATNISYDPTSGSLSIGITQHPGQFVVGHAGYALNWTSPYTGSHQGYATDGVSHYTIDTTAIYVRDYSTWAVTSTWNNPRPTPDLGQAHLGDGDISNGVMYVPIETWTGCTYPTQYRDMAILSLDTATGNVLATWNASDTGAEASGVAADTDHNILWVSSYCDGSHVAEYNLTTGAYVGNITLVNPVAQAQGVAYKNGLLYLAGGTGNLYVSDLSGNDNVIFNAPTAARTQIPTNVTGWEGIDYTQQDLRWEAESNANYRNVYSFTPSGLASFVVTSDGRLGLNTQTPAYLIDGYLAGADARAQVAGDAAHEAQLQLQSGSGYARFFERASDGNFGIYLNGTTLLRINATEKNMRLLEGGGGAVCVHCAKTGAINTVGLEAYDGSGTANSTIQSYNGAGGSNEARFELATLANLVRWFYRASDGNLGLYFENYTVERVLPGSRAVQFRNTANANFTIASDDTTEADLNIASNAGSGSGFGPYTRFFYRASDGTFGVFKNDAGGPTSNGKTVLRWNATDEMYALESTGTNLSIGYASGTACPWKLCVNGGVNATNMTLKTVSSVGNCDSSKRGLEQIRQYSTSGNTNPRDMAFLCLQDFNGNYAWTRIAGNSYITNMTGGTTSVAITFGTVESDTNYVPVCTVSWNAGGGWWSSKTVNGFTWNVATAPGTTSEVDCTANR